MARSACGLLALAERVVEDDDVRPVDFLLPVAHLGHEAVGDVALFLILDEVADLVALLRHLPGDVADESGDGYEKKLALVAVHGARSGWRGTMHQASRVGEMVLLPVDTAQRRLAAHVSTARAHCGDQKDPAPALLALAADAAGSAGDFPCAVQSEPRGSASFDRAGRNDQHHAGTDSALKRQAANCRCGAIETPRWSFRVGAARMATLF